jgi:hypothetical protein
MTKLAAESLVDEGMKHFEEGRYEEAVRALTKALAPKEQKPLALLYLALSHYNVSGKRPASSRAWRGSAILAGCEIIRLPPGGPVGLRKSEHSWSPHIKPAA